MRFSSHVLVASCAVLLVHGAAHAAAPLLGAPGVMDTARHGPLDALQCFALSSPDRRVVLATYDYNGATEEGRTAFVASVGLGMGAATDVGNGGPVGAAGLGMQIKAFDVDIAPGTYLASSIILRGTVDGGFTLVGEGEPTVRTAAEGLFGLEVGSFQTYSARLHLGWSHPIVLGTYPVLRAGFTAYVPLDEGGPEIDDFETLLSKDAGDDGVRPEPEATRWGKRRGTSVLVLGVGVDRELQDGASADSIRFTVGVLYP